MKVERYEDIGQMLRSARNRHGLDVNTVSQALFIRARYITAIEEGRLGELPGGAYAKGYIANYAGYLGLDKDQIVTMFESLGVTVQRPLFQLPETLSKDEKPSRQLVLISFVLTVLIYFAWSFMHQPVVLTMESEDAAHAKRSSALAGLKVKHHCLSEPQAVYPPCYEFSQPLHGSFYPTQVKSILELGAYYRRKP